MQEKDNSAVRKVAVGGVSTAGMGFLEWEGLLYRWWMPRGRDEDIAIEQLVLPTPCRKTVLQLAHELPLAGHMGKKKTAEQILQHFYWPSLFQDVAEHHVENARRLHQLASHGCHLSHCQSSMNPFSRWVWTLWAHYPEAILGTDTCLWCAIMQLVIQKPFHSARLMPPILPRSWWRFLHEWKCPGRYLWTRAVILPPRCWLRSIYRLLGVQPIRTSLYLP